MHCFLFVSSICHKSSKWHSALWISYPFNVSDVGNEFTFRIWGRNKWNHDERALSYHILTFHLQVLFRCYSHHPSSVSHTVLRPARTAHTQSLPTSSVWCTHILSTYMWVRTHTVYVCTQRLFAFPNMHSPLFTPHSQSLSTYSQHIHTLSTPPLRRCPYEMSSEHAIDLVKQRVLALNDGIPLYVKFVNNQMNGLFSQLRMGIVLWFVIRRIVSIHWMWWWLMMEGGGEWWLNVVMTDDSMWKRVIDTGYMCQQIRCRRLCFCLHTHMHSVWTQPKVYVCTQVYMYLVCVCSGWTSRVLLCEQQPGPKCVRARI